jgi:hypothetical protein
VGPDIILKPLHRWFKDIFIMVFIAITLGIYLLIYLIMARRRNISVIDEEELPRTLFPNEDDIYVVFPPETELHKLESRDILEEKEKSLFTNT